MASSEKPFQEMTVAELMHEFSLLDANAAVEIAYDGGVTRNTVRVYKYNEAIIIEVPS